MNGRQQGGAHCAARWAAAVVVALPALGAPSASLAGCAPDPQLARMAYEIASTHFPQLIGRLPAVEACDRASDLPGAVGEFSTRPARIRVLMFTDVPVATIVSHELGHAEVHRLGGERGFGGHGVAWQRVMIRAGFADEARRTAELRDHYPGLLAVHHRALRAEAARTRAQPDLNVLALLREEPGWLQWLQIRID